MVTQEILKELFEYDSKSGCLIRRFTTGPRGVKGSTVGTDDKRGYLQTKLFGKFYKVHRLIWLYEYGKFPDGQIDHINGKRSDNRIENLRDVSNAINSKNQRIRSTNNSGVTGVSKTYKHFPSSDWSAYIFVNYKKISLGRFSKFEDAVKARKAAEVKYGFHENHGKKVC